MFLAHSSHLNITLILPNISNDEWISTRLLLPEGYLLAISKLSICFGADVEYLFAIAIIKSIVCDGIGGPAIYTDDVTWKNKWKLWYNKWKQWYNKTMLSCGKRTASKIANIIWIIFLFQRLIDLWQLFVSTGETMTCTFRIAWI